MFSDNVKAELERLRGSYPEGRAKAALVPVLQVVQRERGWIDVEARAFVADFLGITTMEVHEVVSFYPMLYGEQVGRHLIHVCRTLSCDACGGKELFEHISGKLGIGRNETTPDGKWTLKAAECLASCGTAPMMLIDNERHENLTHDQVDALLEQAS